MTRYIRVLIVLFTTFINILYSSDYLNVNEMDNYLENDKITKMSRQKIENEIVKINHVIKIMSREKSDEILTNMIYLADLYFFVDDFDNSNNYLHKALDLINKEPDNSINKAEILLRLGIIANKNGNLRVALKNLSEADYLTKKSNEYSLIASIQCMLAKINNNFMDYQQSLYHALTAVNMLDRINDNNITIKALNQLAIAYSYLGKFDSSNYYFDKALKSINTNSPVIHEIRILIGLGALYIDQVKDKKAQDILLKAEILCLGINNKPLLGLIYYNLGIAFMNDSVFDKAELYFESALNLSNQENHLNLVISIYEQIGLLNLNKNNYNLAIKNFMKSLEFSNQINNIQNKPYLFSYLSLSYERLGNKDKAIKYSNLAYHSMEENKNKSNANFLQLIRSKTDTEKYIAGLEQQNIINLKEKVDLQKMLIAVILSIGIIILSIGITYFYKKYQKYEKRFNYSYSIHKDVYHILFDEIRNLLVPITMHIYSTSKENRLVSVNYDKVTEKLNKILTLFNKI